MEIGLFTQSLKFKIILSLGEKKSGLVSKKRA